METKDTSTVRRVALMTGSGAALLFVVQRMHGQPALDFEVVPRFYAAAALAFLALMFAYLSMLFERFKDGAAWLEALSAGSFGLLVVAWVMAGWPGP